MARGKTTPKAARRKSRKLKGRILAKKKKEFLYRGKTIEEMHNLSLEEVMELLPSRARRSLKRGMIMKNKKFFKHVSDEQQVIRTHSRELVILPSMVNRKLSVYDGKAFQEVMVTSEMIGHHVGEFVQTRKVVKHTGVGVGATRSSKYMPLK